MNKQDNFFKQFKEAAKQTEAQRFPGFDEVWQQVESRLDNEKEQPKIIGFHYKKWLAIAASFIVTLLVSVAIFQNNKKETSPFVIKDRGTPKSATLEDSHKDVAKTVAPIEIAEPNIQDEISKKAITNSKPSQENKIEEKESVHALDNASDEVLVRGIVTDTSGQPLSGASILIEGTYKGVMADSTGSYSLKASKGEKLSVQMIGFDAKKIVVRERYNTNISLEPSSTSLSEVVVTGYATQKKNSETGSVATIQGQQLLASNRTTDVNQALYGKVAGVQVNSGLQRKNAPAPQKSITPGAGTEVRIRGIGSVKQGNEPLYVVNGIPANGNVLKAIDPSKIDKIDVLKDASATALYGSRAQNGVIIITTKALTKKEENDLKKLNVKLLKSGIKMEPLPVPNQPDYSFEEYNPLVENPFTSPQVSPLSTFSIDVDNASYSNIRRYINNGEKVPQDAVRVEEMINYFKYRYEPPTGDKPFAAQTECSDAPWNKSHKLLRIALKAKDIPVDELPPSNIVFLIDVSGSMNATNKLPLLKSSMKVLVDQMRKEDKVSIVVYAGAAGLVLPPTSGDDKATIMEALNKLDAGGSTAGGAGIELAYKTAEENFIKEGNNRVVLATDGDFNVGINSQGDLQRLIEEKRKTGIFLTCLGFGMGNYKDGRLETLADKGNGNYAYIDNMQESNRFLGKEFKGTVFTVAKDVKLQIEFNPAQVKSYRLIGYENRKLNDEDFVNDKIDAGEMGIGHTVTALYEIIPVGVNSAFAPVVPELKYTKTEVAQSNGKELATLKFRYKKPDGDSSTESVHVVSTNSKPIQSASEDFRFAAAVAWFGLKLRNSELIADKEIRNIISLAKAAQSYDPDGYRAECIRLMETAK